MVVYMRRATDPEMRLCPQRAPALRSLAERGVSFPDTARLDRGKFLESLRTAGREIGDSYRELLCRDAPPRDVASSGSPEAAGSKALAELASELGRPPPASDGEKEALRRLRAEQAARRPEEPTGREPAGRPGGEAETPREKGEAPGAGDAGPQGERQPGAVRSDDGAGAGDAGISRERAAPGGADGHVDVGGRLERALAGGARLILVLDGDVPAAPAPEKPSEPVLTPLDARGSDSLLEDIRRRVFGLADRDGRAAPRRLLLVLLAPPEGSPALIAAGHSVKKGRVSRERLDAKDIAAGVRRFLGLHPSGETGGSGEWISRALLDLSRRDEGRDR